MAEISGSSGRIGSLDGLRGIAALWVLIGHAMLLTGWHLPLIGDPDLGVDLFIMLSGFLMVFHYQLRQEKEPWSEISTWSNFWTRRFFRIAPLYYVMLAIAIALGPVIFNSRMVIDHFLGVIPQLPERYLDGSLENVLLHVSFLFGLSPAHAFRTPLPDWSISLEMQFYAALPFLMLLIHRLGWLRGSIGVVVAGVAISMALRLVGINFPMPAFLPLKMHVFASGMLLAGALNARSGRAFVHFLLALAFVAIPIGGGMTVMREVVRLMLVVAFFALIFHTHLPRPLANPLNRISDFMGNRFCHELGELSFGAYLIHLLVMQPVIAYLIKAHGHDISNFQRFLLSIAITIPIVYALSAVGHRFIEMQGQKIGRTLTRRRASTA
ncbi:MULTISPECIES: acyltransferase family protein [unclassified Rhizobium]|uniref:acyltransferase family protein n=1 Tax=unclassified Rhizobium TaxID=2613769 RepID=UPI001ADBA563|nr:MULTISPECIES: acyltransferase [unclassified Rhizobium]MBO9125186.1 acyltransferase [Rhizobium sp. 16-488-2b]MBO9175771.1 acyltransferase [Rhizobium sp. 16-488-2a]